jgi:hypothetical protein
MDYKTPIIRSLSVRAELVEALPFLLAVAQKKGSPSTGSGRTVVVFSL